MAKTVFWANVSWRLCKFHLEQTFKQWLSVLVKKTRLFSTGNYCISQQFERHIFPEQWFNCQRLILSYLY